MIALALMLAQAANPTPQHGPWEKYQQPNPYGQYSPHNLILRWGPGAPVSIRYDDQKKCEAAAVSVAAKGDTLVLPDGRREPPPADQSGSNRPAAFCIPA